jgi:anti-sigma-K factor RskA
MTRDEVKELFPLYAIGALDADELRAVEAHLQAASRDEKAELAEWRDVVAALPLSLPEVAPPAHLRARLLDCIGEQEETLARIAQDARAVQPTAKILPFTRLRKPIATPRQQWLLMAASILLALASVFLFWRNLRLGQERDRIAEELKQEQLEKEQIFAALTAESRIVPLDGQAAPQANAKVVWDQKHQLWKVFIVNLPAPPSDKDYQLWYVTDVQKISAQVFRPDERGHTMLELKLPREAMRGLAATAVTLEPRGGSPQPTNTDFYLMGKI